MEGLQALGTVHVIGVDGDVANDDGEHGVHGAFDAVGAALRVHGRRSASASGGAAFAGQWCGDGRGPARESMLLSRMGVFEDSALGGAVAVGLAAQHGARRGSHGARGSELALVHF